MLPLAELALDLNYHVSGTDIGKNPDLDGLRKRGARILDQHSSDHIKGEETLVYSSAIGLQNQELMKARDLGCTCLHRSELLHEFMKSKRPITVAGTHGKTTTTAMIAHMLKELGEEPGVYLGGKLQGQPRWAMKDSQSLMVAEADESDGSFLIYEPFVSVLTDVGLDHLDFYQSESRIHDAFRTYLNNTSEEGVAIVYWDNPVVRSITNNIPSELISYGKTIGSEIRLYESNVEENHARYTALVGREKVDVRLNLIGEHNMLNSLAALGVARALELNILHAAQALSTFEGVDRRLCRIFESKKLMIYDDYAHNPQKIKTSLQALKSAWPNHRIFVIFQPHRYSRIETMYNEFIGSFELADLVMTLPVFAAGESINESLTSTRIADGIKRSSKVNSVALNPEDVIPSVLENLNDRDIVISLGAGDVYKVAHELKEEIKNRT